MSFGILVAQPQPQSTDMSSGRFIMEEKAILSFF